jgi:opacity protein-like surface antigen
MPTTKRRRRLVTTTVLAVLTAGALAAGAAAAGAAPATAAVTVQDPPDTDDPRGDLRSATVALSADKRYLTVSARLYQPTSPTAGNWWRGTSLPRPGIVWGLNTDPSGWLWDYTAQLRGDPDLGTYGFVAYRGNLDHDEPRCRVAGSFDGTTYRMRFPVTCIGSPAQVRLTAYIQLYNDTADGIFADYAPAWGEFSPWLRLR